MPTFPRAIPDGLAQCADCGEFRGEVRLRELSNQLSPADDPEEIIRITCLCQGIPCPKCKVQKIHRPISNSYDPETNTFSHWPYFSGMMPCALCRREQRKNDNCVVRPEHGDPPLVPGASQPLCGNTTRPRHGTAPHRLAVLALFGPNGFITGGNCSISSGGAFKSGQTAI